MRFLKTNGPGGKEDVLERISRERFIRVGAALGVSAASASVLAACGGGDTSGSSGGGDTGGTGSSSGASTMKETMETTGGSGETTQMESATTTSGAIASESEVAPGSAKKFKDGGKDAVLVRLDSGDFVAYSAVCTHQQCTVAYKNGQLACPCHGSIFDAANGGAVTNGPANRPLPEIPIKVEGGNVVKA